MKTKLDQLDAQLLSEADPEKRAALMEQIEEEEATP
jgi:hypothetical protein